MRYRQNEEVAWRMVEGEAVLVHPSVSEVKILNAVGSRIWELLEEGISCEAIVETLYREFEVEPEAASRDAEAFLRELEGKGLVVRESE